MSEIDPTRGRESKAGEAVLIPEGLIESALSGKAWLLPFFEHTINIPGAGEGMLHVEDRFEGDSPHTPPRAAEKIYSCISFGYAARNSETGKYEGVAEMTLAVHNSRRVELRHRLVQKEWRQAHGIGTALLNQVEDPIRRHAEKAGEAMEIFASLSQYDVLKFLTKAGYEPRTRKDKKLLADITEGLKTGRYVIEEQTYGADDRHMLIFEVIDGVRMAEPIRLSLKKVFPPRDASAS